MPTEKILARIMIALGVLFVVLSLAFYPSSYAIFPSVCVLVLAGIDSLLPSKDQAVQGKENKWKKGALKVLIPLLAFLILAIVWSLARVAQTGPFTHI